MTPNFGEIAERLRRSTVHVGVGREGAGSGVIWDRAGVVVTNAHVARADRAEVTLWDGRRYGAEVTRRDEGRDLAALQIQAPDLAAAEVANSAKLRAGEMVIAVGNPLGFLGALTTGVVHTVGPVAGLTRREFVQASVRLAPGNSGGPLADAQGRVVGINSMVVAGGLGLAIPSNAVRVFLEGRQRTPRLGITIRPVTVRYRMREAPGQLILEVAPGSLAERASLMQGDVLVGADGKLFETWNELSEMLDDPAEVMAVSFLRGDRRTIRQATVRLREPAAGVLAA